MQTVQAGSQRVLGAKGLPNIFLGKYFCPEHIFQRPFCPSQSFICLRYCLRGSRCSVLFLTTWWSVYAVGLEEPRVPVVLGQLHKSVCLCKTVNVCMRLSTPVWKRMFLSMSVCICGYKYTPGCMCHLRTLRLTLKPPAQGIAASQLNCRSLPSPTTPTVVHDSPTRGQRPASLPVGRPNFAVRFLLQGPLGDRTELRSS